MKAQDSKHDDHHDHEQAEGIASTYTIHTHLLILRASSSHSCITTSVMACRLIKDPLSRMQQPKEGGARGHCSCVTYTSHPDGTP